MGGQGEDTESFRIEIPDEDLDDLRRRLAATRWPEPATVTDGSQGIELAAVRELCDYWADGYDWRRCENELNALPQLRPVIDGLGFHVLHIRSPHPDALPLVMTHGWPGSIIEFLDVVGPLTDPTAHGGTAADAFHLVLPTLPGFGFSDKPTQQGWGIERIARAWGELMPRLGYDRYGVQGGDWGAMVATSLAQQHKEAVIGVHVNMAMVRPDRSLTPTDEERAAEAAYQRHRNGGMGYLHQQATRPQTLGYGLVDSPAGQAAWILDKLTAWTDGGGDPTSVITRDRLLDNIMLYWLPAAAASSARLYWESAYSADLEPVTAPAGVSVFPGEIHQPSRRQCEQRFTDLRHYNRLERGGHFAAFEQPATFTDELRTFFTLVR